MKLPCFLRVSSYLLTIVRSCAFLSPRLKGFIVTHHITHHHGCRIADASKPLFSLSTSEADEVKDIDCSAALHGDLDRSFQEESSMIREFVSMIKNAPPGSLEKEDIALIRSVLEEQASSADSQESAQLVETLLFRIVDEWEAAVSNEGLTQTYFQPTASDFNTAIVAWENSLSPMAAKHVGFILSEQEEMYGRGVEAAKPDMIGIKVVLRILSQSRDKGTEKRAWSIYNRMKDVYELEPDAEVCNSVIMTLAKSKQRGAAQRAEHFLREVVEQHPPSIDERLHGISIDAFNAVITGWAKSDAEDGPLRAGQLLDFMNELDKSCGNLGLVKPNIYCFTSLIDAHVQKGEWESIYQAEQILNHVLNLFFDGDPDYEPTIATWTIVIGAWARLSKRRIKGAAERADKLLKRLENLYQDGRTSVAPDNVAYFTVMNALAASNAEGAVQKAEDILNEMYEQWMDGNPEMKPSTKSTRVVIDGWIKSSDDNAMTKAESLLRRVQDLNEENFEEELEQLEDIHRSILFGYCKRHDPLKAHEYLNVMIEKGMRPDSFCYDKIIEAYTLKDEVYSLKKTYAVFALMEQRRQLGEVKPNERVYTSFIRALTRANIPGLASKASRVLNRMDELFEEGNKGIMPTVFTYNALLNACAETRTAGNPKDRLEAFKIAIATFNRLRNNRKEEADHVTYGNMLRCASLLPDGEQKDDLIRTTFRLCCNSGFVNYFVVRDLVGSTKEALWRSLLSCADGDADMDALPNEWSRRIKRRKKTKDWTVAS